MFMIVVSGGMMWIVLLCHFNLQYIFENFYISVIILFSVALFNFYKQNYIEGMVIIEKLLNFFDEIN
jgi:uncharacterized membrane protein YeiH